LIICPVLYGGVSDYGHGPVFICFGIFQRVRFEGNSYSKLSSSLFLSGEKNQQLEEKQKNINLL